ncbi:hypothetical protein [Haloarchaeobius sp. HRN-SO-5]|uniref:hypothetical protein n=1 Tax=Haloarchaeobius sp. HRN-SO-5 TaxID=3446118 RepID=UPI003EB8E3B1
MTEFTFAVDAESTPYNLAFVVDDRSHLYDSFDVDPSFDDGVDDAETEVADAPPDYSARRAAIVEFYGHRCGRCSAEIGTGCDEAGVAYLYQLTTGREDADVDGWALRNLVAVCEPCYDLLDADSPDRIGSFGDDYRRAPQFPAWTGDPRVAVERLPLSGKEVWLRDRLAERVDVDDRPTDDVNEAAARHACLARSTPAAVAVALGECFVRDELGSLSTTNRRLSTRWESVPPQKRQRYERRAVDAETVVGGGFEPCVDLRTA